LNPSSTTEYKQIHHRYGHTTDTSGSGEQGWNDYQWTSTNALTSMTITKGSADTLRYALYGIS
jgi:hypothetical protein